MSYKANPRLLSQLQTCEELDIPWAVVIGESELKKGVVKLRHIPSRKEVEVKRANLVQTLQGKLNASGPGFISKLCFFQGMGFSLVLGFFLGFFTGRCF